MFQAILNFIQTKSCSQQQFTAFSESVMDKLAKMDGLDANMQTLLQTQERNTKTVRQAESKMNSIKS